MTRRIDDLTADIVTERIHQEIVRYQFTDMYGAEIELASGAPRFVRVPSPDLHRVIRRAYFEMERRGLRNAVLFQVQRNILARCEFGDGIGGAYREAAS